MGILKCCEPVLNCYFRVEYDAYRLDLDALKQSSARNLAYSQKLVDAEQRFRFHTDKFERLRGDVIIKMKFLDDNRVRTRVFLLEASLEYFDFLEKLLIS